MDGEQMVARVGAAVEQAAPAIGAEQIREFVQILQKYKAGRATTEARILASENWWKLRNTEEERKEGRALSGLVARSAWLHNVIVSKHADAMEAYPTPVILPREQGDQEEATRLTSIVPCILERCQFEEVYSDAMWQKGKTGTGVYKVVWDGAALGGLGDVLVAPVNLLNIYWEPGKSDIQESRYFFHAELVDKDVLEEQYPHLAGQINGQGFWSTRFLYDDHIDVSDKHTVVDVYYHKGGRLQYVKFVGDKVLYATENDPEAAQRGLYDHGLYPYVFDPMYPIEGSPCGYGYVDICRNPQMTIDTLRTAYIKNAMVGSAPRYFTRQDGTINEEEFLDLEKPLVHVNDLSEDALRRVEHSSLDGTYYTVLDGTIQELRETSGNTETSTGTVSSGVTAASAIAALQEASGKGSRDSIRSAYRAYTRIVYLVIELVRQFYDVPRQFRIMGEQGAAEFVSWSNANIKPQHQGVDFGQDMGYRVPVFDIKVEAQKKSSYSTLAQNELALQLYGQGLLNPNMADQALLCLEMMEFEGKDRLIQKVAKNAHLMQMAVQMGQLAMQLAAPVDPMLAQQIAQQLTAITGQPVAAGGGTQVQSGEPAHVQKARDQAQNAAQPG